MLEVVDLLTLDEAVVPPEGIIFSTHPHTAEGSDGHTYFVKGPEVEVVFPELAGSVLASLVGLPVPDVSVCRFNGQTYCGSRKAADVGRDVIPWLETPPRVTNFGELFCMIAVDVWLANTDRNPGNVLGCSAGGGRVELKMIDFEKSRALGPNPITFTPTIPPARFWPTGLLGEIVRHRKPLQPPTQAMARISGLRRDVIDEAIGRVTTAYQPVEWAGNSAETLASRATRIGALVGEVWN